jgi:flagellar M-ring protein FliF
LAFFQKIIGQLGTTRLMIMGGVGAVLLLALTVLALRSPKEEMGYLFTELDPQSASAMTQKLQAQNVPYQISPDGTAIMAPQNKLAELRMSLAGDQLSGKIGYEVLDEEQPFGLSAAREKMNETRAIEGELAKSIATLDNVNSARVRIVMPEKAIFGNDGRKASAAITLKTRGRLSSENVQAIRNLVASSVPDLAAESVSIIDQQGRLLARAGDASTMSNGETDERQAAMEARIRQQVEALLEPLVGEGRVRAEVTADLDRDAKREETREFDPDKQVISHQISVESGDQSQETGAAPGGATVGNQLPGATAAPTGTGDQRQANSKQASEDTTYDNSRTDTVTERAPGALKRLSVAVMIDSNAKLPAGQIQKLTRLVEGAVGYDTERGDSVVVDSMPFAVPEVEEDATTSFLSNLPTGQIFTILELLVVAGVGLAVMRMLKPKVATVDGGMLSVQGAGATAGALPDAMGQSMPLLDESTGQPLALESASPDALTAAALQGASHMAAIDQEIAMAQVEGGIKASSLRRIGETITTNPAESASVIRQWMNS